MKVAFYLKNNDFQDIDFTKVEYGNPGVGGSEYLAVLIPTLLSKSGKVSTTLFVNKKSKFYSGLDVKQIESEKDVFSYIEDESFDAFVVDAKKVSLDVVARYPKIKFILWAHNFLQYKTLKYYEKMRNVVKIVNVGLEQMDLYRDMTFYDKETFIYNVCPFPCINAKSFLPNNKRKHYVVYVGSLIPTKGFHLLAKAWPKVLASIPDAELFVIGSGNLYNHNTSLGKLGIAEEEYENLILEYIGEKSLNTVHFLGRMGNEKSDVLLNCKVGVPNPSGNSETFGITAVEMQYYGCQVVTKECPGYIDTVYNTKALYKKESDLAKYIIRALNDMDYDEHLACEYVKSLFSKETIVPQWEFLLSHIDKRNVPKIRKGYHLKYLKECIRIVIPKRIRKNMLPVEFLFSHFLNKL